MARAFGNGGWQARSGHWIAMKSDANARKVGRRADFRCALYERQRSAESCLCKNCNRVDDPAGPDRGGRREAGLAPASCPQRNDPVFGRPVRRLFRPDTRNGWSRSSAGATPRAFGKSSLAAAMRCWTPWPIPTRHGSWLGWTWNAGKAIFSGKTGRKRPRPLLSPRGWKGRVIARAAMYWGLGSVQGALRNLAKKNCHRLATNNSFDFRRSLRESTHNLPERGHLQSMPYKMNLEKVS
ncbi:hypothetical protein SAMN05444398_107137 [Roseovarius pacificus]|uniref:Uncharacterized protein n=1 Tax=Roseovarius pacificus TaxID=337701 RepID=A0A1M7EN15_9RHOB|nr:hypothetical protein SAMN05444398_107137 [Roseovarius pacificus]